MSLEQDIIGWDGASSNDIEVIYRRYGEDSFFLNEIIRFLNNKALQKAATWLLKRTFDDQETIGQSEVKAVYDFLPGLEHWESKLHVLQCIPFMPVPISQKKVVEMFLRDCLADRNKFVRAWAYNGFYELSVQYPEYEKETKQIFDMAMRDESPSVKARIRNVMKKWASN